MFNITISITVYSWKEGRLVLELRGSGLQRGPACGCCHWIYRPVLASYAIKLPCLETSKKGTKQQDA